MKIKTNTFRREWKNFDVNQGDTLSFEGLNPERTEFTTHKLLVTSVDRYGCVGLIDTDNTNYKLVLNKISANLIAFELYRLTDDLSEMIADVGTVYCSPVGYPSYSYQVFFAWGYQKLVDVECGVAEVELKIGDVVIGDMYPGWYEGEDICYATGVIDHEDMKCIVGLTTHKTDHAPEQVVLVSDYGILTASNGDDVFVERMHNDVFVPKMVLIK